MQKQKFAPENFSKKRPLEEKNDKKTTKDTGPDRKNTKRKKGQHFPLGGTHIHAQQCVTVRLPCPYFPHPLPGLSFTAFCRKGVGGVRPNRCVSGDTRDIGPHPRPQKTIMIINLKGAKDV